MECDVLVIGTGQAGPPLARSLSKKGKKVALVEKSHLGGTCVNVGCTPTKTYLASARKAFVVRNSKRWGVNFEGDLRVDLKEIKKRKDELIQDSRNSWEKSLTEDPNITLIRGKARFTGPHAVEVNRKNISARKIYINVGARPNIPEEFEGVDYLTNESILELEEIPKHLIIIGGGYVGLEFAQMFRRFGSKVSIFERGDRLMKKEDENISEAIQGIFKQEGINIQLNSDCIKAEASGKEIEMEFNCDGKSSSNKGSHLLIATGRVPNTDDLGLEKAGITTDKKGYIKVNDRLQTNLEHVFALGDCNGEGAFTHTAYNDFQIVNSQLFEERKRDLSDRFPCYAAFIDPPLARVGMNKSEIQEKGINAIVFTKQMSAVARAKETGETEGLLEIFVEEETEKILGANFLGIRADEYIHSIIDIMYADVPYSVIRDAVHIHPTVSELIPTMFEDPEPL